MAAEPVTRIRDQFGWVERVVALGSLGAAAAYAALRTAAILFYGGFGITPEDLGLGELDLLVRSVGLLIFVFAVAAAIIGLLLWVGVGLVLIRVWDLIIRPPIEGLQFTPWWFQGIVTLVGIFGVVVIIGGLFGLWRHNPLELAVFVLVAGGWLGYAIWGRSRKRLFVGLGTHTREQWRIFTSWYSRAWRPGLAVVLILSLVVVAAVVTTTANSAADAVRHGRAYRAWSVPWTADPATVRWVTPRSSDDPLTGRCLMYLGQSNSALVLYDVDSRRIVRVPSGLVILLVDTTADTCSRSRA